jgi:Fe-S-cluster containining protein
VAFHWLETAAEEGGIVPSELTVKLDRHRVAMHGTEQAKPRCRSLLGEVGRDASCGIYAVRPSPCRDLSPAWEDGTPSPQCDRARIANGMPVLQPGDWADQAALSKR